MGTKPTDVVQSLIPLTEGARRLRERYRRALDDLLAGKLDGERDSRGRWMVTVASVERLLAGRAAASKEGMVTKGNDFADALELDRVTAGAYSAAGAEVTRLVASLQPQQQVCLARALLEALPSDERAALLREAKRGREAK